MEDRLAALVSVFGLGIGAFNYYVKSEFANLRWVVVAAVAVSAWQWGSYITMETREGTNINYMLNYAPEKEKVPLHRRLFSFYYTRFFIVGGLVLGAYWGFNGSVAYNLYLQKSDWSAINIGLQCVVGSVASALFYFFENNKSTHSNYPAFFTTRATWTMPRFLLAMWNTVVIGEYVGFMIVCYAIIYEVVYYYAYQILSYYSLVPAAIGLVAVCCVWGCISNFIMWRRQRAHALKEECGSCQDCSSIKV